MSKIRIRQTKDTNAVHALDVQTFDYKIHHPVNTEGSVWWLVYDGNKPVAYAGATHRKDNSVYLCRAGVLESHRGLGLQRELIKRRVKWARDSGADYVITYTESENIWSSNNLIKCDFLLYSPDLPWGTSEDALYWKRVF